MLLPLSRFCSLSFLRRRCNLSVLLPFYHLISDEVCPHISALYRVRTVAQFEADLDYLCAHFEPVDLPTLAAHQEGEKPINRPSFHLTFDDGLRQCFDIIRPILLRRGIAATFFVNSEFVDNCALMFRYKVSLLAQALRQEQPKNPAKIDEILHIQYADEAKIDQLCADFGVDIPAFLRDYQPYCTTEQLQTMQREGFAIGSHSQTHPLYSQLDLRQQLAQTVESQRFVSEKIYQNKPDLIPVFAFPFSDDGVKAEFWQQLRAQIPNILTFGTAGIKADNIATHLQRLPVESEPNNWDMAAIIQKNYFAHWLKKLLRRHIVRH
jgi:peptidoglycan/xylan/chitin deacetylase (PgdA/CDA1 family)